MPRLHRAALRSVLPPVCAALLFFANGLKAHAQDMPPAYLSVVEGVVTLEREGEREPAVRDMPFVPGDRLRTENGRAEIQFPDGTAIEIGEDSLVEAVTPSRVRLLAGTMDHVQGRTAETSAAMSAAYLPADLQTYGDTFDRDGSWQYAEPHGYVWYPRVAADWRPYYFGSWAAVPSYGWTWIGIDRWSWPTHHYGRWGYARNSWFWIPGRTWGAAWVSWAAAPDYLSWCPLGYDGRPVFGFSAAVSDPRWRYGAGGSRGWNGWTVMPRGHFGARGAYVHRDAVEPRQLPENTAFVALPQGLTQSSVASHQSSVASHQSSVESRQWSVASRQSSVPSSRPTAPNAAPAIGSAIGRHQPLPWPSIGSARPATGDRGPVTADRRPATDDRRLATDDWRLATPRSATPRAASAPPPAQPAPAAPPAAASAPAQAPAAVPPAPPTPHARSAPAGAPREGTARRR